MESGLLELQEDSFAALQMASPFRLMIPGPEVLQRLLGSLPQAIGAFNSQNYSRRPGMRRQMEITQN